MGMTVSNAGTLTLLNILNRASAAQSNVMQQMATGKKINKGVDDPAGMLALSKLNGEMTAVDAGITNNERTDAILGVADNALSEVSNLVNEIQKLANETANDAGLSAEEVAANQSQIDDALNSIDRIVTNTNFNGKKLLDGSMAVTAALSGNTITDLKVFSRNASDTGTTTLKAHLVSTASATAVLGTALSTTTSTGTNAGTFMVQGKLGTVVIAYTSHDHMSAIAAKVNASKTQTGVSATTNAGAGGAKFRLFSTSTGSAAFVRVKSIEGTFIQTMSGNGKDAVVTVNGQATAADGSKVSYSGGGISISFDAANLTAADVGIKITNNDTSGATFQLGTNSATRATIGIDGMYTAGLGNATDGYLKSLSSGGAASLVNDPNKAATIARAASLQIATLQGRIGGFEKFQVRTSLNSLNSNKEGLDQARATIQDVDYAVSTAELNRQNVLMQSAMSLLGMANQQSSQVLTLLR